MRFAGYVRVSDVGGRDKQSNGRTFLSPTEQREKIQAWAEKNGHELVETVEDLNRSGRTERRNLTELVEKVRRGSSTASASPDSIASHDRGRSPTTRSIG
jgi:DNA invertase Pin-like site-specific DNA recombinase